MITRRTFMRLLAFAAASPPAMLHLATARSASAQGSSSGKDGPSDAAPGRSGTEPGLSRSGVPGGATVEVEGRSITVLYRDGKRERIEPDRYVMKDSRGRTIIDRKATPQDWERLRSMAGR